MNKKRIAIFASGNGSNAEEITRYFKHHPGIEVAIVFTNNPDAYVIERAKNLELPYVIFNREQFRDGKFILDQLYANHVTHIALAGFLWLIPDYLIKAYPNHIINIHPALLPLFGGKGMYGMKVHETVLASGARETGITIHLVNEHYDKGKIVFQGKCAVEENCTLEDITEAVHALEYKYYPPVIEKWITEGN
jgi:phosphoribosylglycinamide formyltransferase 1